jgi:hypothetical protein
MFEKFMTGKKIDTPSGTEHERVTGPVAPLVPAKNQTEPWCPTMQEAPVGSKSGLEIAVSVA